MEHDAPAWAIWLEHSGLGELLRSSSWLYPAANVAHVVMMALLVGAMVALDLRLLGLARRLDAAALNRYLTRFAYVAIPLMLLTGLALFSADASFVATNPAFWVKMSLLALALINAALFTRLWRDYLPTWDTGAPAAARLQVLLSLLLWPSVAICGRLLAYF
jgi:hypothetical protein